MLFWGATIAKKLCTKIRKNWKKGPQRPRRLATSFPIKVQFCKPTRPNCTLKLLPEKKRRGNQNEKEPPPETENKGIFAQDKARKKRERRRTCLRRVLPYTSNFSSNLCRCVFLASEPWRRKTLQYTSHLYCSMPPLCTAMIRPLL